MRKRHFTDFIKHCIKIAFIVKPYNAVTVFHNRKNRCFHKAVSKDEFSAFSCFFARTCKNLPLVCIVLIEKKELNNCSRTYLHTVNTGRQNSCIIENQAVAFPEIIKDIIKMLMLDIACFFIENQQTGCVARFNRALSNQFFRQIVKKIAFFHHKTSNFLMFPEHWY